jgi:hypothetical protein
MKAFELLNEKPVDSTWIVNLMYNRPNKVLTMRLSNGRAFSIPGISRRLFDQWTASSSVGHFFHTHIKDRFEIKRIT